MTSSDLGEKYNEIRKHQLIWPALLVLAGVGFLLENFGILPLQTVGRFWPILLILWGVDMIWRRTRANK